MKQLCHIFIFVAAALALAACEGTKKQLGLTRNAPDEFAVVKRAPLEMPPGLTLPPPQPGAPRPQEIEPAKQAQSTIFGEKTPTSATAPAKSEAALLLQAGADDADPGIRTVVNRETENLKPYEKPVAERLLGIGSKQKPPATVVDAAAEAERIKRNLEEGRPVTEGETPSIRE